MSRFCPHGRIPSSVCTLVVLLSSQRVRAGDRDKADFKAAYPGALQKLERAYSSVVAWGLLNREAEARESNFFRIKVIATQGLEKAAITIGKVEGVNFKPRHEAELVLGKDYAFEVERNQFKNVFNLKNLARNADATRAVARAKIQAELEDSASRYLYAPFKARLFDMRSLTDPRLFRVDSAERVSASGEEVMRVRFTSVAPAKTVKKVEVDLLPDRCWAVRRADVDMTAMVKGVQFDDEVLKQLKIQTTITYGPDQLGVPVPSRVSFVDGLGEFRCDFDEVRLGVETDAREFTLRNFGLPDLEPPPVDAPRGLLARWLYAVAAVTLVGAIALYKRER